jgi:hypothetical protein
MSLQHVETHMLVIQILYLCGLVCVALNKFKKEVFVALYALALGLFFGKSYYYYDVFCVSQE